MCLTVKLPSTLLIITNMFQTHLESCAERLVDLGVIKSLVYHMDHTNDTAILKNIAICCALLSKTGEP